MKPIPKEAFGERILSLEDLEKVAKQNGSVIVLKYRDYAGPYYRSARLIFNYSGQVLLDCFREGMYVNIRKDKR